MAFPISVIQLDVDPAQPDSNRDAALALAAEAISKGARLVLLPEACVTDFYIGAEALAEPIHGPLTNEFSKIARDSLIALPLLEKSADGIYSACALVSAQDVLGAARKTHLYHDPSGLDLCRDDAIVRAGNSLTIIDAGSIRVGIAIGFDAEFPEVFRALATKGADAILVALNCVEPDIPFLSAMAKRNRVAIAVANRIGFKRIYPSAPEFSATHSAIVQDKRGEYLIRCKGGSAIIGPDGEIAALARAQVTESAPAAIPDRVKIPASHFQEEEILTASFVIDELRIQRLTHPFLTARRGDLYL
ncbi:MAG TPA: carbon-nitrogen hydrolase family protein [Planctomycetota bacterium]|nr:carbon-nitrogen hydrolase family protein [Planctomycetota bacterium]